MKQKSTWPFEPNKQIHGMKLPLYLAWATGQTSQQSRLFLPAMQRGFVWKPRQIVDLWDSLLRGMPVGSLMVSALADAQPVVGLVDRVVQSADVGALGLMDGQQRTLAMLMGWQGAASPSHSLWINLAQDGQAGAPFDIRLTTQAQPFGFQGADHARLPLKARRQARKKYDETHPNGLEKRDVELFATAVDCDIPRPWVDGDKGVFVRVKEAWRAYDESKGQKTEFQKRLCSELPASMDAAMTRRLDRLYVALARLTELEVPLILIPEHLSAPVRAETSPATGPDPMVLLFERIGRNGASLSAGDLLFSMIKQQWPHAQTLINQSQTNVAVRVFMGPRNYVMTAFRLAMSDLKEADNPRPDPHLFHRHLAELMGATPDAAGPLRLYISDQSPLTDAFTHLHAALLYRPQSDNDAGLPLAMLAHLSRGLVQVLLRWAIGKDAAVVEANRGALIAFSLYWFLHVLHEDKATKQAFAVARTEGASQAFPAAAIYQKLIKTKANADALLSGSALDLLLITEPSPALRSHECIFRKDVHGKVLATDAQRDLYKRFCWTKKPLLLWLQRAYVHDQFHGLLGERFAGLTDEESVPYDYDHLCPQNHWGADWRGIKRAQSLTKEIENSFKWSRAGVGNCIGNLHVLEASLNRSFGDDALEVKLTSLKWTAEHSQLYHDPISLMGDRHADLWLAASPRVGQNPAGETQAGHQVWTAQRLEKFQEAVYRRARGLYGQYAEACSLLDTQTLAD